MILKPVFLKAHVMFTVQPGEIQESFNRNKAVWDSLNLKVQPWPLQCVTRDSTPALNRLLLKTMESVMAQLLKCCTAAATNAAAGLSPDIFTSLIPLKK